MTVMEERFELASQRILEIEKENITEASEQGLRPRLGKEKTD